MPKLPEDSSPVEESKFPYTAYLEVALINDKVQIRDPKAKYCVVKFTEEQWGEFLSKVKAGEYDL